jgi:hypothetical protein
LTDLESRKSYEKQAFMVLLGGIVMIGAAFLLLNFRVPASNTQTEKLIFTTDMGDNIQFPCSDGIKSANSSNFFTIGASTL